MNFNRISPNVVIGILLGFFFFVSFSLRVFPPFDHIFGDGWIKLSSVDAYFHVRLADSIAHNFPALLNFDPYFLYPGGHHLGNIFFTDWLIGGFAWLFGLGSPTQHTVDIIAVYFPVIMAALTVIPVYFIGRALFNRWAGIIAALLVAVFPGEYLGRSLLGFTDTPSAEVLFSTTTLAFFILAIKEARQRGLTFGHIIRRDWSTCTRPLVYSLFAGIFSGIYLISWVGALLFIFIITAYLVIQFIINHLKGQSVEYLSIVSIIMFLISLIIFAPLAPSSLYSIALVLALLIPAALAFISWILSRWQLKTFYYPVSVVGIGVVVLAIFYAINPDLFGDMINLFSIFVPAGETATTTLEMQPFLSPQGPFTTQVAWSNFTTSFFLLPEVAIPGFAFISLSILIYLYIRRDGESKSYLSHVLSVVGILIVIVALMLLMNDRDIRYLALIPLAIIIGLFFWRSRDEKHLLLFFVWTLTILAATLAQRRFAYYLVVNLSLLSAYISWEIIWWGGLRKLVARQQANQEQGQTVPELSDNLDYYEVMGTGRNASRKQIKALYRNISAQYQHESTHTPEEEEKFKEITRAYEVLVNPQKRAEYDRKLSEQSEKRRKESRTTPGRRLNTYYVTSALAVVLVLFLVIIPNINKSKDVAAVPQFAPSDAWQSALTWLKDNSPDPFGDPDTYYRLYEPPPAGETFQYPESAYGVTAWWDYGYWISRIAHRLPSANPGQDPARIRNVAKLFLSENETTIRELMQTMDSSYVIADYETSTTKFWAVATWAGRNPDDFLGIYIAQSQNQIMGVNIFELDYYRTTFVRLFNFDGKAVTDVHPVVITYNERVEEGGNIVRLITDAEEFTDYQEALEYAESQGLTNHRVVGVDPMVSPMPLEALEDFELVYTSESGVTRQGAGLIPGVKIFKYNSQ